MTFAITLGITSTSFGANTHVRVKIRGAGLVPWGNVIYFTAPNACGGTLNVPGFGNSIPFADVGTGSFAEHMVDLAISAKVLDQDVHIVCSGPHQINQFELID